MSLSALTQHFIDLRTFRWNTLVGKMQFVREEDTHMVFLHPTKGYRRIAKKRLGL